MFLPARSLGDQRGDGRHAAQHQIVNDRDYVFEVPAPPKPAANAVLRVRVIDRIQGNLPAERIEVLTSGIRVTLPFDGVANATAALSYGKSFFVGWEGAAGNVPDALEFEVRTITVHDILDPNLDHPTQLSEPPGEYVLYLDVNGRWVLLNTWAPGLGSVLPGQVFQVGQKFALNVPQGQPVRVFGLGRECDLPKIEPCAATVEVADDNDAVGNKIDFFTAADAALGDHVLKPDSGHWELAYTIRRAAARATRCADTLAPRSSAAERSLRASRSRIAVRGGAGDRSCGGAGGRITSASVAIAKLERGRCRFAGRSGRLGARRACTSAEFLPARGGRVWRFNRRVRLPAGRYGLWTRATDAAGNVELAGREPDIRFRLR